MRARVSSCQPQSIGYVAAHRLIIHKRSIDGSAKADAFQTGCSDDRVWGAIYTINQRDQPRLDQYENLGTGYDLVDVEVATADGPQHALMYVAREECIERDLKPYDWYKAFLVIGALQHRLPYCYVSVLNEMDCMDDRDAERQRINKQIIEQALRQGNLGRTSRVAD